MSFFDTYVGATHGSKSDYEERFGKGVATLLVLLDKLPEFIQYVECHLIFTLKPTSLASH